MVIGNIGGRKENKSIPVNHQSSEELEGTFSYDENVKYQFDGKGKGCMHSGEDEYEYTYTIEEQEIKIDFEKENIRDATYQYKLEKDILTLIGKEGTTGGQYTLKKEDK